MSFPKVSIIVPCYNQAQYFEECLQSVLKQTYIHWECIIVNDGSLDNTEQIAKKWCEKDSRISYIYIKNQGVSNARNVGIKKAKGLYILPLDGDDVLSDNYIEEMILNFDNDTTLVYGEIEYFGILNEEYVLAKYKFDDLLFCNMIHCSGMFKKTDFLKTNGYDCNMREGYEDWEFWISLLKNGGLVKRVTTTRLFYRKSKESRSKGIDFKIRYSLVAYIYHKHSELYDSFINDYSKPINIYFAYSFYLSAIKFNKDKISELKNYFNFKLKSELKKYTFIKRKKMLFHWFRLGKFNLSIIDVLVR